MIIYFSLLGILFVCHGWRMWKERDGGGIFALLSLTVLSVASGIYYYYIHG